MEKGTYILYEEDSGELDAIYIQNKEELILALQEFMERFGFSEVQYVHCSKMSRAGIKIVLQDS